MKNKVFIFFLILTQIGLLSAGLIYVSPSDHAAAAASGLVAAYGFNEGTGTTLKDRSGNGNNGTLRNGPVWVSNAKFGKALRFDGINDIVTLPDSNSLDLTTGMTLEAWVYPRTALTGWDTILMKEYASGLVYALYANGADNVPHTILSSNNTEYGAGGGITLPLKTWTHVASTFDGSTIRLFINGAEVQTTSFNGSIQTSNGGFRIGGSLRWKNRDFSGVVDEVRIYNRALTASEIVIDMETPVTGPPPAMGPLKVSTANPRYFAKPNGTIVYLTGAHTWCNFIDCGDTNPISTNFNYTAYLDFLVAHNHNFFRLWRTENARGGEMGPDFWFAPMPYQRSTTCCAFDGGNKFDLTKFDQAYFDRMRQRVIQARDRGIYVSIMLFDGWSIESKFGGHNPWEGHPYKLENNINKIDGDQNNDNQGGETHTLSSAYITTNITPLQKAYIKKVIDTVNDLDNVLYEVSNESPSNSEAWQYSMINFIKNYEAGKPKRHPVGMTWEWPGGNNNDLYNSPADWISLGGAGDINTYVPPAADGSVIIMADTDHLCGICGSRQWVWKSFTRGENPVFMDGYDTATSNRGMPWYPLGYEEDVRTNLGYTRNYANRINLAKMTPRPGLCSTGFCLAKATSSAAEYLAYLPSGGSVTINLSTTSGTLIVEWFNPANGATTNGGTVNGAANRTLTAPFSGDAVVYLKSVP